MAISFSKALGIRETSLALRTQRAEVLASNLANVDTPNYKARDIDFKSALSNQISQQSQSSALRTSNSRHISTMNNTGGAEMLYRTPSQPSLDGNTVDEQAELSRFAKNTLDFQASFQFLNGSFKGLSKAIKGEI